MELLSEFFASEKIEYFGVIAYSDCIEISPQIIGRESFTPRSVILFLMPYYSGEGVNLSRYARSRDYHIAIRGVGARLIERLSEAFPEACFKTYGDHSPINEAHAAMSLGLGVRGDSGLLLNEKYGSYTFLGDVVTDIPPELLGAQAPVPIGECHHCGRCKTACPTGILAGTGTDCLSAITQRKGELAPFEIDLMLKFNTAWGCDVCQSVCPYNKNPVLTPLEFFLSDTIDKLTYQELEAMPKARFEERAFAWRGRKTVMRNVEILESEERKLKRG